MKKGDKVYRVIAGFVDYEKIFTIDEVTPGGNIYVNTLAGVSVLLLKGEWVRAALEPTEEDILLAFDVWEKQGDCDPFSAFKAGIQLNKF